MVGVREKNKRRRESAILTAAMEFFDTKGYEKTTIEEIAEQAEVGVGTVYNYFGTKSEILLRLMKSGIDDVIKRGHRIIAMSEEDPYLCIMSLAETWLSLFYTFRKDLWRELLVNIFLQRQKLEDPLLQLQQIIYEQIDELVEKFQQTGKFNPHYAKEGLVGLLYAMVLSQYIAFISNEDKVVDQSVTEIAQQVQILFTGIEIQEKN